FAPPIHTFTIRNGRDVFALLSFLVIGGVVSALVDLATRRREQADRAQNEARALAGMATTVLRDPDPLPRLMQHLATTFKLEDVRIAASVPDDAVDSFPLSDGSVLVWSGGTLHPRDREVLAGFATQLALAVQGRRLQAEAATAATLAQANELRTALL